ncbi:MAG TPA: hypothetical protein VNA17_11010 [Pyrinomonadaceae bacterium]|nr:hypothetical protein [Pyrinomonadaceae bacterium]
MQESLDNATTKLAHVLFMDIVGYSKLPTDDQRRVSTRLKDIVRATPQVSGARNEDELISLYTGDGMALVFFGTPLMPVECAVEISRALKHNPDIGLRMGVHSGLVQLVMDVNDKLNVAGGGINTAQRVMDCGGDGHILISRRVADDLEQFRKWREMLHDLGETRVKHDQPIHVVNLYDDEVGNPELPCPFREKSRERRSFSPVLIAAALGGLALAIAAAVGFLYFGGFRGPNEAPPVGLRPESDFIAIFERKRDAWIERIFSAQAPSGGIKASPSDKDITHQGWATAQCVAAVLETGANIQPHVPKIRKAFEYIDSERRKTPTDGWSLYGNPNDIYTITEVGAWITLAYIKSVDARSPVWAETELPAVIDKIERELSLTVKRQDSDGGFRPIIDEDPDFSRTYSTAIALWSLIEARRSERTFSRVGNRYDENIRRAINWLMRTYREKQGWVQNPNRMGQTTRFDGLTAQTLYILSRAAGIDAFSYVSNEHTYKLAQSELVSHTDLAARSIEKDNSSIPDGDVRFTGTNFVAEGSTFLWFPWVLLELAVLSTDNSLPSASRDEAAKLRLEILNTNADRLDTYVEAGNFSYIMAENLFCVSAYLKQVTSVK